MLSGKYESTCQDALQGIENNSRFWTFTSFFFLQYAANLSRDVCSEMEVFILPWQTPQGTLVVAYYRCSFQVTLDFSSSSNTGFLGRGGGEGMRVLSTGMTGSDKTMPESRKEKEGHSLQVSFLNIVFLAIAYQRTDSSLRHWILN